MSKGVETHRLGTIALDGYHETRMGWLMRHHSSTCDVDLFIHGYTEVGTTVSLNLAFLFFLSHSIKVDVGP